MKRSTPFEVKSMEIETIIGSEFLNGGNDTVEQTLRLEEMNDDNDELLLWYGWPTKGI